MGKDIIPKIKPKLAVKKIKEVLGLFDLLVHFENCFGFAEKL
jgi:hypothetical protein